VIFSVKMAMLKITACPMSGEFVYFSCFLLFTQTKTETSFFSELVLILIKRQSDWNYH